MQTTIAAKGWYCLPRDGGGNEVGEKLCKFVVRFKAYAGQPFVMVSHRTINTIHEHYVSTKLADAGFETVVNGRIEKWRCGFDGKSLDGDAGQAGPVFLHQDRGDHFRLMAGDKPLRQAQDFSRAESRDKQLADGKRSDGWMTTQTSNGSITYFLRDIYQKFPRELEVDISPEAGQSKLVAHFWPKHGHRAFTEAEELARDPRVISRIKEYLESERRKNRHRGYESFAAFLYQTTGDKAFLKDVISDMYSGILNTYECEGDRYDGYCIASCNPSAMLLGRLPYVLHAVDEAGLKLERNAEITSIPGRGGRCDNADKWLAPPRGWSNTSVTILARSPKSAKIAVSIDGPKSFGDPINLPVFLDADTRKPLPQVAVIPRAIGSQSWIRVFSWRASAARFPSPSIRAKIRFPGGS